jgi:hypothetical protein
VFLDRVLADAQRLRDLARRQTESLPERGRARLGLLPRRRSHAREEGSEIGVRVRLVDELGADRLGRVRMLEADARRQAELDEGGGDDARLPALEG